MEVGSSLSENLTDGDDTQVDGSSFKCDQEQWAEKIFRMEDTYHVQESCSCRGGRIVKTV